MAIELKSSGYGYYVITINGNFYGTYDTYREALDDVKALQEAYGIN